MTSVENRAFFVGHPVPLIRKGLYKYICKRFSFDMDKSELTKLIKVYVASKYIWYQFNGSGRSNSE